MPGEEARRPCMADGALLWTDLGGSGPEGGPLRQGSAAGGLADWPATYARSTIVAVAIPWPMHITCSPYRPPTRSSSWTSLVMRIAPVAPSG